MPELPEVQTVINSIKNKLINKKIVDYKIFYDKICYNYSSIQASEKILNQKIESISRLGKNIIFNLNDCYIVFHLRMTGYLYCSSSKVESKYLRYQIKLSDGSYLNFEDIRKFGGFYYLKDLKKLKNKLGKDPFDNDFSYNWLENQLLQKNAKIKSLLLRQDLVCGLGNIYIDEILWKSKIKPQKISKKIHKNKIKSLHLNTINTLSESIKFHGTTIINFKFDNMKTGDYKNKLNVYGRENKKCKRCNNKIKKIKMSGRSTYYCKFCQC